MLEYYSGKYPEKVTKKIIYYPLVHLKRDEGFSECSLL